MRQDDCLLPIITLTTDFGTHDPYVGAMKGVLLSLAPGATVVDITHDIEPHNIAHGAFVLRQVWSWYPLGTIHLVVVDPGVGSDRRILAGMYGGSLVVAPDNGLITLVHGAFPLEAMHAVENPRFFLPEASSTFHGRDIMAPVAAHLANGVNLRALGRGTDRIELLASPSSAHRVGDSLVGSVLHVDRFGTLVTTIAAEQLAILRSGRSAPEVWVNDTPIGPIRRTFSDVAPSEPLALIGSCDLLEIAVNRGRAVDRFGDPGALRIRVQ